MYFTIYVNGIERAHGVDSRSVVPLIAAFDRETDGIADISAVVERAAREQTHRPLTLETTRMEQ